MTVESPFEGPEPGELAWMLTELAAHVRRYVVVSQTQADLVALWIVHTHVYDAAEVTPYLSITGPERRVGKTRLLDVLALFVRKPVPTANTSVAALFRLANLEAPTLLFDEVDTVFGSKARENEDLRGAVNAGFQRGAKVWRCVGDGSKQRVEGFAVYCPKAFAGIGDELPGTIVDRSITVRLKRKTRAETVERFRVRRAQEEATALRERLAGWGSEAVDQLAELRPELPDELDDRAQDAWEPLLAIATLAGGEWPERANRAALELSAGEARVDDSLGVLLLGDIRQAFTTHGVAAFSTRDLVQALASDPESPWAEWWDDRNDRPARGAAEKLAHVLRPFGVRGERVRIEERQVRGYKLVRFEDAFARYLSQPVSRDTSNETGNPHDSLYVTGKTGRPPSGQGTQNGRVDPSEAPYPGKPVLPVLPVTDESGEGLEWR